MNSEVTMTGLLGTEPELHTSKNGHPVVKFRFACTPRVKREGNWTDDGTIWFSVNAWNSLARNVYASLHKGDRVIVRGRMRLEQWLGRDGVPRENKIIDATAIGVDLAFAIAPARRMQVVGQPVVKTRSVTEPPPDPVEEGEQAGVDLETGEVLDEDVPQVSVGEEALAVASGE